ncbi:IS66 family insertion sequence element accessory protein TnpB [Methylobacter sp. S3L5C]|uniref:IS66 family insertion sequence element accessory protein TnpB n=1 Tax=Methylobacter sp. S3L5C TaxID=2839024 RepID=UPI001FAD74E1|nr:IS66 family insertion sequence element accessory protein TnpB [Methylobacter sp. S3L5C]UOA09286.1 IS66 family insertion sequence element accessory protein TnpB [Methylobacter sp. S3L5C]
MGLLRLLKTRRNFRRFGHTPIKVLLWDGTGVWLCQRRLHEGGFVWPKSTDTCFSVTFEQWQWLIAGVNWQRLSAILPADLQM